MQLAMMVASMSGSKRGCSTIRIARRRGQWNGRRQPNDVEWYTQPSRTLDDLSAGTQGIQIWIRGLLLQDEVCFSVVIIRSAGRHPRGAPLRELGSRTGSRGNQPTASTPQEL